MRRLFSTFAHGGPGVALLLMRVIGGGALIAGVIPLMQRGQTSASVLVEAIAILAGLLLIAGLWTPIAGAVAALTQLSRVVWLPDDALANVLLATIGLALSLIGPGAYSVDARLFGWKRIELPDRPR